MLHTTSCAFGIPKHGIKAIWEITNRCNENCRHCCNAHRRDAKDISLSKAKEIVRGLKKLGTQRVVFSGGEPLLYPDIFDLASYCMLCGIEVCFSTNGLLISEFRDQLTELQPKKLIISLDGFSPNSHDEFRGVNGSFFHIIKSIESLRHILNIEIHTVINRLNVGELRQLATYCDERKLTITFSNLVETKEQIGLEKYVLSNEEYDFYIRQINHDFSGIHIVRHQRGILGKCPAGTRVVGITSSGEYTPCLWISNFTNKFNVTRIEDIQSIDSISDELFPFCVDCHIKECGRGCPAIALSQTNKIDPLCIKNYALADERKIFATSLQERI